MTQALTPPAAPRRIRSGGWTIPRQRQFLKHLAVTGSVERACDAVGTTPSSAYRLRLHPDGAAFRDGWAKAIVACVASLRELAFDRAINGTVLPIMERGELVGRRVVHNDRLLMFMLREYDGQRPGGQYNPGAWPQAQLIASFDDLEPADIPDAEIVEAVEDAETSHSPG